MLDQFLTFEQQNMACRYSAFIVCIAAIVIGMKAFDKNLISDMLGDPKYTQATLTQNEKYAYTLLFVAGIVCAWCNYMKKF